MLEEAERLYMALADKTRLRILNLIRDEEVCVCFFVEALKESQPKISRHLAYLRKSSLVSARKEGKWVHYKIEKPSSVYLQNVLDETLRFLETQEEMQKDYQRLVKASLSTSPTATITKPPKPITYADLDILNKESQSDELETFLL